jgi:sulfur relay (sulfurtransferase) complex TusBCD TusD component (DsrE family)
MKLIKQFLLALSLIIGSGTMPALAGATDSLFINLSTDSSQRVDHALHFGSVQLANGHPLTIFLNGRGVLMATKQHVTEFASQQKSLAELMDKGATVIICQYCMKQNGVKESDLLPGYKVGNPELVGGALFKDNTKTISW